jgi:hypothetical protein
MATHPATCVLKMAVSTSFPHHATIVGRATFTETMEAIASGPLGWDADNPVFERSYVPNYTSNRLQSKSWLSLSAIGLDAGTRNWDAAAECLGSLSLKLLQNAQGGSLPAPRLPE